MKQLVSEEEGEMRDRRKCHRSVLEENVLDPDSQSEFSVAPTQPQKFNVKFGPCPRKASCKRLNTIQVQFKTASA